MDNDGQPEMVVINIIEQRGFSYSIPYQYLQIYELIDGTPCLQDEARTQSAISSSSLYSKIFIHQYNNENLICYAENDPFYDEYNCRIFKYNGSEIYSPIAWKTDVRFLSSTKSQSILNCITHDENTSSNNESTIFPGFYSSKEDAIKLEAMKYGLKIEKYPDTEFKIDKSFFEFTYSGNPIEDIEIENSFAEFTKNFKATENGSFIAEGNPTCTADNAIWLSSADLIPNNFSKYISGFRKLTSGTDK